tara:strand:- start:218 stop:754 length:537 start_codon:yes stop_codon:yes gene_type:complete
MSRIGKLPIALPKDVKLNIEKDVISIKGPFGTSALSIPPEILLEVNDEKVVVKPSSSSKKSRSMHGSFRSLLANDIHGVNQKFDVELQLIGVGYRCEVKGNIATLRLGYSHGIDMVIPDGVTVTVEANTAIKISGAKKDVITQFAAQIRSHRPPEPYNGKGVLYKDEQILRKSGKSGK